MFSNNQLNALLRSPHIVIYSSVVIGHSPVDRSLYRLPLLLTLQSSKLFMLSAIVSGDGDYLKKTPSLHNYINR